MLTVSAIEMPRKAAAVVGVINATDVRTLRAGGRRGDFPDERESGAHADG